MAATFSFEKFDKTFSSNRFLKEDFFYKSFLYMLCKCFSINLRKMKMFLEVDQSKNLESKVIKCKSVIRKICGKLCSRSISGLPVY